MPNMIDDHLELVSSGHHEHKVVDSLGDEYVIHSDEEAEEITTQQKIWDHMSQSSLLIIHKDWAFRQFMIKLTTAPITKQVTQKDILLSQI